MSTKKDLFYYKNSQEPDAVRVRKLITEWWGKGASRNYNSDLEYFETPEVYKKACLELYLVFEDE